MKYNFSKIILITIILFLIPLYLRISNDKPIIAGDQAYELLLKESTNPYSTIINTLFKNNKEVISIIISFILGISSITILYLLLKDFNVGEIDTFYILLCFTLSPIFVSLIYLPNYKILLIFLYLLFIYLFSRPNSLFSDLLNSILLLIISLFGITHLIFIIITTIVAKATLKEEINNRKFFYLLSIIFIMFSIYYNVKNLDYQYNELVEINHIKEFISDFGSSFGFSIFNVLLSFLGIVLLWSHKKKYYLLYSMLILTAIFSVFNKELIIYSNIVLSIFAGIGFSFFVKSKWQLDILKKTTLILLFCSLLFSSLSYAIELGRTGPDKETKEMLKWLGTISNKEDVILSHYSNGFWIEYYAKRKSLLNSNLNKKGIKNIYDDYQELLYSYNLDRIKELLDKYEIRYIIITKEMKEGLVWDGNEEGLNFMIRNTEIFKNIYKSNSTIIVRYKK